MHGTMNIKFCAQTIQYIVQPFNITRRRSIILCSIPNRQGASLENLYYV